MEILALFTTMILIVGLFAPNKSHHQHYDYLQRLENAYERGFRDRALLEERRRNARLVFLVVVVLCLLILFGKEGGL